MRPFLLALPIAALAVPAAAQSDAPYEGLPYEDGAIVPPEADTRDRLESLSDRLSDPRTQDEIAATVSVLSEILLDLPLAPLIEPLAEATADAADVPRRPVDPDLTLRRMSPRAGEATARIAGELPRAMDRMADMSDGLAALIPALREAARRIEDSLPRE